MSGTATVHADQRVRREALDEAVRACGYEPAVAPWLTRDRRVWRTVLLAALGIGAVAVALHPRRGPGRLTSRLSDPARGGLLLVLVLGVTAGVSTCMAMVGGLVLGFSASHAAAMAARGGTPPALHDPDAPPARVQRRPGRRLRRARRAARRPGVDDEPAQPSDRSARPRRGRGDVPARRATHRRVTAGGRVVAPAASGGSRGGSASRAPRMPGTATRARPWSAPPRSSCPAASPRPCRSTPCRPRRRWPPGPSWRPSRSAPPPGPARPRRPLPEVATGRRRATVLRVVGVLVLDVRPAQRVERPEPARGVRCVGRGRRAHGIRQRHRRRRRADRSHDPAATRLRARRHGALRGAAHAVGRRLHLAVRLQRVHPGARPGPEGRPDPGHPTPSSCPPLEVGTVPFTCVMGMFSGTLVVVDPPAAVAGAPGS